MNESKTIKSYRNKESRLNGLYSITPKKYTNTEYNTSSNTNNNIYSYIRHKKINLRNISTKIYPSNTISNTNNNSNLYNSLLKTVAKEKDLPFSYKKYKTLFKKKNNNYTSRNYKSEKLSLKFLNDFFKPESNELTFNNNFRKKMHKISRKNNFSSNFTPTVKTTNNNLDLICSFPKLFNIPHNKMNSRDISVNTSRFFFTNVNNLKYFENVRKLTLTRKNPNSNFNISDNLRKTKPIFIEKLYTFDILKNVRFQIGNREREKFKHFFNSFYKARNLKFNS